MRLILFCCGFFLFANCALGDEKATDLEEIRFQYPEEDAIIPTSVVRTDDEGNVVVHRLKHPQRSALVEGYYFGLGYKWDAGFGEAVVLRIRVEEVIEDDQARLTVDRSAIGHLKTNTLLLLFRPIGSTTQTMKIIPAAAPLTRESEPAPIEGMKAEQVRDLHESKQNLKEIGVALHRFHEPWACFPPAVLIGPDGKPWHSWRVLLLPYLKQKDLYKDLYERYRFDEPWNGPNNKKLISEMPDEYHDPVHGEKPEKGYTSYAAVVGPDAGFLTAKFNGRPEDVGFAFKEGASIRSFVDGPSKTVMVGLVSQEVKIPWTKPEDIELGENIPSIGGKEGFAAPYQAKAGTAGVFLFADGRVTTIRTDIEKDLWRNLLRRNDRQIVASPPSLGEEARNKERIRMIEYRKTDKGPQAVLKTFPKKE